MANHSFTYAQNFQDEQIQTKLKTLSTIADYAALLKDSGEVEACDVEREKLFDCIDINKQLIDELSMMFAMVGAVSSAAAKGARGGLQ